MALENRLTQEQALIQQQQQRLTAQQLLQVKLLEMPLAQLEENIKTELYENPALESTDPLPIYSNQDIAQNAGSY